MFGFLLLVTLVLSSNAHSLQNDPLLELDSVGWKFVDIEDYPHQVAIIQQSKLWCAGSIITPTAVLSAAHCVYKSTSHLTIHAGSSCWDKPCSVHNVIANATYGTFPNTDLTVLHVAEPFTFDKTRQPIPLFKKGEVASVGDWVFVAGWGFTESGEVSNQLVAVKVPLLDRETCNKYYGGTVFLGELCTGPCNRGPYKYDSGSALVFNGRQMGIVTVGKDSTTIDYPIFYIDVAYYSDWINEHI